MSQAAEEQGPRLYPAWRQAEADLLRNGLTFGSLITDEWLNDAFGLKPAKTIAEHERNQLVFLSHSQALFDSLLENHRMMVTRVRGAGYSVLPPERQTPHAMRRRVKEVKAALRKLTREVSFVKTEALNDGQRKENADALAKIGSLRSMVRKQING